MSEVPKDVFEIISNIRVIFTQIELLQKRISDLDTKVHELEVIIENTPAPTVTITLGAEGKIG